MIQNKIEAISFYVAYLDLKSETRDLINEKLIAPKIKHFFQIRNISEYSPIEPKFQISDVDFLKIPFGYFYEIFFTQVRKNQEGKVQVETKYIATLDRSCTNQQCTKTQIWFDEIKLSKATILYFIFFDVKEIFQFLKEEAKRSYKKPDF